MKRCVLIVLLMCALSVPLMAQAQGFPNRPINVVAPFPPGGQADLMARPTAAAMEKILKSPVVVVNKTGAAGDVGMAFVANSKPDGYNLLMALSSISIIPPISSSIESRPIRWISSSPSRSSRRTPRSSCAGPTARGKA